MMQFTPQNRHLDCETCNSKDQSVFCQMEAAALRDLSEHKVSNIYKKGQSLFIQGNPPFGLFCINSGKFKVTKMGADGKETIVRIAAAGDLLGHRSLFSDSPYKASAIALEESRACFINKNTIHQLIRKNPSVTFQLVHRLSEEMGAAENWMASLSQKNIRERFAELLLMMKQSFGQRTGAQEYRLDIRLTREEMASMIGTAPESLIRLVTEFKNDQLIRQDGKTLYLTNVDKIEDYANLGY